MTEPLAAGISAQASDTNFRVGVITAVNTITSVVTVQVQGGDVTNAGWLQSYEPAVGDNVLLALNGQSWIVLGSTNAKPGGFRVRTTLAVPTPTVRITIPANLVEVEIGWYARSVRAAAIDDVRIKLNDSTAGLYTTEITQGNGAATASSLVDSGATTAFVGQCGAASNPSVAGSGKIWFENWDHYGTNVAGPSWNFINGVMAGGGVHQSGSGWMNNLGSPVTSITFLLNTGPNFAAGSTFYVRGYV